MFTELWELTGAVLRSKIIEMERSGIEMTGFQKYGFMDLCEVLKVQYFLK